MDKYLSDGTVSWLGGMDTSRPPNAIAEVQYSKGCNVMIPSSMGGITARFGFHCSHLQFDEPATKELYRTGNIQGEGWYRGNHKVYLICVVSGYVLQFKRIGANAFYVSNLNYSKPNNNIISHAWVTTIPKGCIINNGFDTPIHVTEKGAKRMHPENGDIGIGKMGVYVQNRFFYVDQSGRQIKASDFMQPTRFTKEQTNIEGFMCPDEDEVITAIGRQKTMLGTVEGGNLIWSSTHDIYSADVRGTRTEWSNLQSSLGKTTEVIPGLSATSSYSFEPFNSNLYFRNRAFGLCDLRQSNYQFGSMDTMDSQSIEASYFFDNDTDWMLDKCYTRSCNRRLFTTVSPAANDDGFVYWNGMLSMHPSTAYVNQGGIPRRFESVWTGVRPWCMTVIREEREQMFIHSHDQDGNNRLYLMDESSNYDIDADGRVSEIEGFIETRSYALGNPFLFKKLDRRFYRLGLIERTVKIKLFSRTDNYGAWNPMWDQSHLVCRTRIENNTLVPEPHKGQTRQLVNVSAEKQGECTNSWQNFINIQYRFEFKGPINLDSFIVIGYLTEGSKTITTEETECLTMVYSYRPDYGYHIHPLTKQ